MKVFTNNVRALVVLNEQHSLFPEQEALLNARYGDPGISWEIYPVPKCGWSKAEMREHYDVLLRSGAEEIVFASPVPPLVILLTKADVRARCTIEQGGVPRVPIPPAVRVFHNDHREKKELPNGRIITTVAKTGWEIL